MLTIHETVQTIDSRKEAAKTPIKEAMTEFKDLSKSKISNDYVKANVENDRLLQKIIQLVKKQRRYRPPSPSVERKI